MKLTHRRQFLKSTLGGTAGLIALPNFLTSGLSAQNSPNRIIQVAQIGCGRMGSEDMDGVLKDPRARVVAICELDKNRAEQGKKQAEAFYEKRGMGRVDVKLYDDYRAVLSNPKIDAVVISLPDHWHGLVAIAAAIAGKHMYVQKPLTYNIAEAVALRKAVTTRKVVLQTGSQQRSSNPFGAFRPAMEAVRNGRIGKVQTVRIGVGIDKPSGKKPAPMPVPPNLNYDRWLGPAPEQPYMEGRVHPQNSRSGRPGWITTEDFGLGMITNWGAHHIDVAHWAIGQELGGPTTIEARADFMKDDLWTVHHTYHVEMHYPDDITLILDHSFENGVHFEGSEGWIFCTRGSAKVTASDPNAPTEGKTALRASKASLLSPLGNTAKRLPESKNHYQNWIDAILHKGEVVAPVDQAACSLEACAAAWIGMKLGRKLTWDTLKKEFPNDPEATALCSRKPRKADYDINTLMASLK